MLAQFVTKPPNFAPGEGCRYNNAGFVLLDLCVEHVTGEPYRDYVRAHVFAPAGMDRAGFFRMDRVEPDVAENVELITDDVGTIIGWRRNIDAYAPIGSPDGAAHATARDLVAFMDALLAARLCSAGSVTEMLTPVALHSRRADRISRYDLCLELVSDLDDRLMYVQKDGNDSGVSAIVRHYPSSRTTVRMPSNTTGAVWNPLRAVHQVLWAS